MDAQIKILLLEDDVVDVIMITRNLESKGLEFTYTVCDNEEDYRKALEQETWDMIISDYNMPRFDALDALRILRRKMLDLPFIIVSGAIDDDKAVEAMEKGAHDYVLKDNLARLYVAIKRELREASIRRKAHNTFDKLVKGEKNYRNIITLAPIGFYQSRLDGSFIIANDALAEILGYDNAEELMQKRSMADIYYSVKRDDLISEYDVEGALKVNNLEVQFKKKDGSPVWVLLTSQAVKKLSGETVYYDGFVVDITENKQADKALRDSEKKHRNLIENMGEGVGITDEDDIFVFANAAAERIFGVSAGKLIGSNIKRFVCDETYQIILEQTAKRKQGYSSLYDLEIVRADGEERYLTVTATPCYDENGQYEGTQAIFRDTTERKLAEQALQKNLEERELLIKELYHRTKNNMQVIASMLNLEARMHSEQMVKDSFQNIIDKIFSMSLAHQKLYEAKDLCRIDLKEYINSLIMRLKCNYQAITKKIKFEMDLTQLQVSIDTAVPLGLVLTEIITNAIKHAFQDSEKGKLIVNTKPDEAGGMLLEISDNGCGLKDDIDLRKCCSIGMRNIFNLMEYQLKGKVEYQTADGLHWKLYLPQEKEKKRI